MADQEYPFGHFPDNQNQYGKHYKDSANPGPSAAPLLPFADLPKGVEQIPFSVVTPGK
jgi:hypothetical protein